PSRLRSPWCPASSASTLLPSTTLFRSLGLGDRGIGDIGGRVVDGITRAGGEVRVLGGQQGGAAGDDVPVAVVAELEGDRADVRGARAGLDDRADLAVLAGDAGVPGVGAVGVAVEDRVGLRGGLVHDLVE